MNIWADQSGNGAIATGTLAERPTTTTDVQGNAIVRFPFNSSCRMVTNGFAYDARAVSIWVVARLMNASGSTTNNIIGINGYGGGSAHMRIVSSTSVLPTLFAVGISSTSIRAPMNLGIYGVVCGAGSTILHDATTSVSKSAVTADATNTGGVEIGAFVSSLFAFMDVYEILIYGATQSAQDQTDTKAYLAAKYSVATSYPANLVVFDGDSITAGIASTQNQSMPFELSNNPAITANWRVFSNATSGATLTTLTARTTALDSYLSETATIKALITQIGRNDMTTVSAATFYASLVTYYQARVTAGWTAIWDVCNIANTNTTVNGRIVTANATRVSSLKSDAGVAKIIRADLDPRFDNIADCADTNIYADGTHLTNLGNSYLGNVVSPFLAASGFTLSGASTGTVGSPSSNITVTLANSANFNSAESVILTTPNGTITATAASGIITNNGTAAVTVAPADATPNFTFTLTAGSAGAFSIVPTNGNDWANPSNYGFTANSPASGGGSYTLGFSWRIGWGTF